MQNTKKFQKKQNLQLIFHLHQDQIQLDILENLPQLIIEQKQIHDLKQANISKTDLYINQITKDNITNNYLYLINSDKTIHN